MADGVKLVILPGDGIGPELATATETVLWASGVAVLRETHAIGFASLASDGVTFPEPVFEAARAADGIILGPVSHNAYPPLSEGGVNPSGSLRRRLDLFANIRPARSRPGLPTPIGAAVDLVIMRENTEGFYADRTMHLGTGEVMPTPDLAMAFRKVTRAASLRIAEASFELAGRRRGKVTAVHKANVLRVSDGLFLDCVREVSARWPDIAYDEMLVDAACAHLVRAPGRFDVICTTNMFGDILSDLASELAGGLGLAASLNAGRDHAMAQAQHGSAPDIAGQDRANPTSLIGSTAMLLAWLGERRGDAALTAAAAAIDAALEATLADPATRTADLGGALGCQAFAGAVADRLRGG